MLEINYEVEYKEYFNYQEETNEVEEPILYCDYSNEPIFLDSDFIEVDGLVILEEYYNDYMEEREDD